ncbi:MAG TPA: thiamine phosphate synthase [Bdellovibrionota bacterium]|nr:thiamine phosphate synthase [Bdellovibrionota bacterium]
MRKSIGRLHVLVSNKELAKAAIEGNTDVVQFRAKNLKDREFLSAAQDIAMLCRSARKIFIVNDRVDVALSIRADGVHLGPHDLPVRHARRILGTGFLIGASVDTPEEAAAAREAGADYLGAGPVYPTDSKLDAGPVLGLEGLRNIVRSTHLPVIAIGGIRTDRLPNVLETGVHGVAILSAISRSADPTASVWRFHQHLHRPSLGSS